MRFQTYTDDQKEVALAFYDVLRDTAKAAKKSGVEEAALLTWLSARDGKPVSWFTGEPENPSTPLGGVEGEADEPETPATFRARRLAQASGTLSGLARPMPPPELCAPQRWPVQTVAAPEVRTWLRKAFLDPANALTYNSEHAHLRFAHIGVLWTNQGYVKQQRAIAGRAEIPLTGTKGAWDKAREAQQITAWFGDIPDFIIMLDAVFSATTDDATFCALVEHEMYHCGQKRDPFGLPMFNRKSGMPVWSIRGHDCEEFVSVVRRYGSGLSVGGARELVAAALEGPTIAPADLARICGNA